MPGRRLKSFTKSNCHPERRRAISRLIAHLSTAPEAFRGSPGSQCHQGLFCLPEPLQVPIGNRGEAS
jgi:hypothetical protein